MAHGRVVGETAVERLTRYLFDRPAEASHWNDYASDPADEPAEGAAFGFERELAAWLAAPPRFRAFVDANRDKVRKKLRTTPDPEARRDVRIELLVARLLTADKRIELGFETYGSGNRGPDFTIAFPGERPFNLEVTRPRSGAESGYENQLLAKLRQLPSGAANAVLLAVDGSRADAESVESAVRAIRHRADRREDEFFHARGFDGARGFYELFLRLGGVFVFAEAAPPDTRAGLWLNRSARIALPDRPARASLRVLRTGQS